MTLIVRAIDVGYGYTKYTTAHDGREIHCAHFPSLAYPASRDPAASLGADISSAVAFKSHLTTCSHVQPKLSDSPTPA